MNRRAVSIADIARAAGVSHSTVSRALHDSPLISRDVRSHIQQLAREMGYVPNAIAQSLQTQRTNTIGLVVTTIGDPFFGDVVKGVEQVARAAGLSVFLSASHNQPEQEVAVIENFHRRRVDGILIASSQISDYHAARLAHVRVPTVLINNQAEAEEPALHSVTVDDYAGARLAVEHLLGLGHRAIGYIGAGNRPKSNRRRFEGYADALGAARLRIHREWVVVAPPEDVVHDDDVAAGRALLWPLLAAGVSAVFCYNDMVAIGALMTCREQGIVVPDQLSLVGFDDVDLAQFVTPPLTTVHQPKVQLGRQATQMLLDLLNNRTPQNQVVAPRLVGRASTALCAS